MSKKTDLLISMNYEDNFLALADYLILLSNKHKDNKKVQRLHKALQEMYFHTNTMMIKNRELEIEVSNIKEEFNIFKKQFYEYKQKPIKNE